MTKVKSLEAVERERERELHSNKNNNYRGYKASIRDG